MPSTKPVSTSAANSITENTSGTGTGTSSTGGSANAGFSELGIENTNINTAPGVNLDDRQKIVVGSILDLFAGRPSLPKLSLWSDNATFSDKITKAEGRKQYAAQWYGLQAAFSSIERLSHEVTSSGNPIEMNLSTKYVVKGINKEQRIDSKVSIWTEGEKIVKVQDAWSGEVPSEGVFAKAFRNLNSVVVPAFVDVPKNVEEDAKKGN